MKLKIFAAIGWALALIASFLYLTDPNIHTIQERVRLMGGVILEDEAGQQPDIHCRYLEVQ